MWQNKLHVYIHFVWGTRDRMPYITSEIEPHLYRYIEGVCRHNKSPVLAIGGTPNHVHLLVKLSSTASIADLMKQVKGGHHVF
jgi:putative transposase